LSSVETKVVKERGGESAGLPGRPGSPRSPQLTQGVGEDVQVALIDRGRKSNARHGFPGLQWDGAAGEDVGLDLLRGPRAAVAIGHLSGDDVAIGGRAGTGVEGPIAEAELRRLGTAIGVGDGHGPGRRAVGRTAQEGELSRSSCRPDLDDLASALDVVLGLRRHVGPGVVDTIDGDRGARCVAKAGQELG
jgi:hypothetical protein